MYFASLGWYTGDPDDMDARLDGGTDARSVRSKSHAADEPGLPRAAEHTHRPDNLWPH